MSLIYGVIYGDETSGSRYARLSGQLYSDRIALPVGLSTSARSWRALWRAILSISLPSATAKQKTTRFATAGATVSLDADSPSIGRIAFDASATISGEGTINMPAGRFYVAEGCTALIDVDLSLDSGYFVKYGPGTLALNAAKNVLSDNMRPYEGQIELRLQAGESVTVKQPSTTSREGGVPLLDLRGATLSIGAGTTVRVRLTAAMPNGTYDIVWFDAADAAQIANLSFTFVDEASSGCTGTISAANGAVSLTIGGSSATALNVWRGLGVDGAWSRAFNWTAQDAPVAGGALEFSGTNGLVNVNDTGLTAFPSLSFTSNAGAFDVDLNGAGQGMTTIANNSSNKQIVRGYSNTGALAKSGGNEIELVDPVIGGKLTMASGASLAIRSTEGNTVTVNSNDGAASTGTFRYLGPGSFLTSRIYPNSSSVPVSFEEGATVYVNPGMGTAYGLDVNCPHNGEEL